MDKKLILITGIMLALMTACSIETPQVVNQTSSSSGGESVTQAAPNDGLSQLEGILWVAEGPIGLVLSHGAIYDAKSWEDQALAFVDEDMTSFAVEDIGQDQLIAAGKALKEEKGLETVILIGASAGGGSAIQAATREPDLFDKVILLSPVGDPTSIEESPLLVVFSEAEGYEALLKSTASNLETLVIAGNAHAQRLFNDEDSSKKVMERMLAFIRE